MPFNDNVKGTEELLRQRHKEREGWRCGDKDQGNSVHPRVLNKVKLHWPGGMLPTELGGLPRRREVRLQQLHARHQQRIADESMEERGARLLQLHATRQQRIANESTEERETRLLQLRAAQQQ